VSIIVKIQKNSQIIIRVDIRKKANIKVGDLINLKSLKKVFLIKPQEIIDLSQVWFWHKDWQTEEGR
jgi:bifunctional DNA-binding transcriptional regulator/antitoxin component of YhaV-PrlF toxin-antitoxin module